MARSILAFGMATLTALVVGYVIFAEPGFALQLALLVGVISGVIAYFFFPDKSVSYETEANQLVKEVEQYTKKMRSYAGDLSDRSGIKDLLTESCSVVYDLLDLVRQKDASNIQLVTTTIKIQVEAVCLAMEQYVKIIEKPSYYREPEQAKLQIEEGVRDFDDFVHGLVQRYNQGDLDQVKVELRAVKPMKIPTLGGGT